MDGNKLRCGVGLVLNKKMNNSLTAYNTVSERIIAIKLKSKPKDTLVIQVYAPNEDAKAGDKDKFFQELQTTMDEMKEFGEIIIVMGDFNRNIGEGKEEKEVGPYGLSERNDNGEILLDFCKRNNMMITNTWFQQKSTQYTWTSPNSETKIRLISF